VKYPRKTETGNIIVDILIAVTIFLILVAAAAPSFEWSGKDIKNWNYIFEKITPKGKM